MNRGYEGCLTLYPMNNWERISADLSSLNLFVEKNRRFYRQFHNGAKQIMSTEVRKEGKFEYIEMGEGPVLLALHGLFGELSNFNHLFEFFSKKVKVVIPIMPIYTLPVKETDLDNLAEFVSDFIAFKGFGKVNLLGNSLGGHVALVYASKHLNNIRSMILTGSSGLYENAFGGTYPRKGDKEYLREKIAITFYDPKHATDELVDECHNLVNDRHRLIRIVALAKSANTAFSCTQYCQPLHPILS